jgi:hypothetical protein
MEFPPMDFESIAYANSTTPALYFRKIIVLLDVTIVKSIKLY